MGTYTGKALDALRKAEPALFNAFWERYRTGDAVARRDSELLNGLWAVIHGVTPSAPDPSTAKPADFSWGEGRGAGWAIFFVVGGVWGLISSGGDPWMWVLFVGAGLALVVHVVWALLANGTEEERRRTAKRDAERWVESVQNDRLELWKELYPIMIRELGVHVATRLDVPGRLRDGFAKEFVKHEDESWRAWADRIAAYRSAPRFPPPPKESGAPLSHDAYEAYCRDMLRSLGYESAEVTRYSRDGGIDIESDELVVQCKHYSGSVGAREIRELNGVAAARSKIPVFFTSGTYTRDAIRDAATMGVALFRLSERDGVLHDANPMAARIRTAKERV